MFLMCAVFTKQLHSDAVQRLDHTEGWHPAAAVIAVEPTRHMEDRPDSGFGFQAKNPKPDSSLGFKVNNPETFRDVSFTLDTKIRLCTCQTAKARFWPQLSD